MMKRLAIAAFAALLAWAAPNSVPDLRHVEQAVTAHVSTSIVATAEAGNRTLKGVGSAGGCVPWTPSNLPTAPLWWLETDSGPVFNGSNIMTSWGNLGSAPGLVNVTGSPLYTTSIFNGNPGVRFAASGDAMQALSGFSSVNPVYSIAVIKRTSAPTVGGLWGSGWGPGFQSGTSGVVVYATLNTTVGTTGPGGILGFNRGNSTMAIGASDSSTDTTNPHVISVLMGSSVTPEVRVDSAATTTNTANAFTTTSGTTTFDVGASTYASPSEGLAAYLGALVLLNYNPTTTDRGKLEQYVTFKYIGTGSQPCQ